MKDLLERLNSLSAGMLNESASKNAVNDVLADLRNMRVDGATEDDILKMFKLFGELGRAIGKLEREISDYEARNSFVAVRRSKIEDVVEMVRETLTRDSRVDSEFVNDLTERIESELFGYSDRSASPPEVPAQNIADTFERIGRFGPQLFANVLRK